MNTKLNESSVMTTDNAREVAESLVDAMLARAFDPERPDDIEGAEAAKFVTRMHREGLFVAPLSAGEYAVAPPSMVDPAVAQAADAILIPAGDIAVMISTTLARVTSPALASNATRALDLDSDSKNGLIVGCSCCRPRPRARVA